VKPALIACMDAAQQSAFIAQRVWNMPRKAEHEPGRRALSLAFHALELQLELTRRQIPFSITSGIRFFEQRTSRTRRRI